jgi:hypothetical protein
LKELFTTITELKAANGATKDEISSIQDEKKVNFEEILKIEDKLRELKQ